MTTTNVQVRPIGCGIGAEVSGVDLRVEQPAEIYSQIRAAFNTYGVIFFHDQELSAQQHHDFTAHFGEVLTTQELRKEEDQTRNVGESWHVDMTFLPSPPMATMLLAKQLPAQGGDTLWASMPMAYDGLSDGLKRTLEGLNAVHANVRGLGLSYGQTAPPEPSVDDYDTAEGVLHPVVIRHPETGRKSLFVNAEYTARFEGWTRRESLTLLEYLFRHGQRPEYTLRLHWCPGTVAFWDNRQVWHLAVNDYHGMRRVMSRTVLNGEPPVAAAG